MRAIIEQAWDNRELLKEEATVKAIEEVIEDTLKGNIPPPSSRREKVPASLEAVAMKALSLKKSDRYQEVSELQSDIKKWLDGYATSAEDQSFLKSATFVVFISFALTSIAKFRGRLFFRDFRFVIFHPSNYSGYFLFNHIRS